MSAADIFWAAPPVARTITAAAVCLSVPVYMGIVSPALVVFLPYKILTLKTVPQIWRAITAFLITAPKLGMILDPYFLYTYGSALETTATRFSRPGDFFVYLVFVALVIVLLGGFVLGGFLLLSPLTLALAYTYAQENPHRQLSYFIITFSAKWLPYAMLAMTFVMGSPASALVQASGLVAAHAYDFVTKIWPEHGGGNRWLTTPQVVQGWFAPTPGTATARGFGTAYAGQPAARPAQTAPQRAPAASGGGWASGFSGGAWGERGPGRRLGD